MSLNAVGQELARIPKPDFWIGDLNYRHKDNNDSINRDLDRMHLVYQASAKWNLNWSKPLYEDNDSISSKTDHCFTKPNSKTTTKVFTTTELGVTSDHNTLAIKMDLDDTTSQNLSDVVRMSVRRLNIPEVAAMTKEYYGLISSRMNLDEIFKSTTQVITHNVTSLSSDDIIAKLTYLDELLTDSLWRTGRHSIGTYEVNRAKSQTDITDIALQNAHTTAEAAMLFKRSQKGSTKIESDTGTGDPMKEAIMKYTELYSVAYTHYAPSFYQPDADSRRRFLMKSLQHKIDKYPRQKSCGPDGIHILLYKTLINCSFGRHLLDLYNLCLQFGLTPSTWNAAYTVLIPKGKTNPTVNNSRPISLTRLSRRLFECLLMDHMREENVHLLNLHYAQAGARPGYSTLSQILVSDELVRLGRKYNCLLDIKRAFDTVRHEKLLSAICEKSAPKYIVNLLSSLFTCKMSTQLIINGHLSAPIHIRKGIMQGSVLSPLMFELFIDSLAHKLNVGNQLPKALFFVDDIKLSTETEQEMVTALETCQEFSIEESIMFNPQKCQFLSLPNEPNPKLKMYGEQLQAFSTAKYLGVPTTSKGSQWELMLETRLEEARALLNYLAISGKSWPHWAKLSIYITFVQSKLDYCLPAILEHITRSKDKVKHWKAKLQEFDDAVLSWIFQTKKGRSRVILQNITGLMGIWDRMEYLRSTVYCHILKLKTSNPWHMFTSNSYGTAIERFLNHGNSILHKMNSPTSDYKIWSKIPTSPNKIGFKSFLKKNHAQRLRNKPGVLHKLILPASRKTAWKPDRVLFIKEELTRRLAIQWRSGSLWFNKPCPGCSEQFNRKHFNRCSLTTLLEADTQEKLPRLDFSKDYAEYTDLKSNLEDSYTIMDLLLNIGDFVTFSEVIDQIGKFSNQPEMK